MRFLGVGVLSFALLVASASASPGEIDRGFGNRGVVEIEQSCERLGLQPEAQQYEDGNVLLVYAGRKPDGAECGDQGIWFERRLANGRLDEDFGSNGSVFLDPADFGASYLFLNGATVLRGRGVFVWIEGGAPAYERFGIKLDDEGQLSSEWGEDGRIALEDIHPDGSVTTTDHKGRVLIVSQERERTTSGWLARLEILRLLPNGNRDPDYGENGRAIASIPDPRDLALVRDAQATPDGLTVIGDRAAYCPEQESWCGHLPFVARLDTSGSPVQDFAEGGFWLSDEVGRDADVFVTARGVTFGSWSDVDWRTTITRLDFQGRPVEAFGGDGTIDVKDRLTSVVPGPSGRTVVSVRRSVFPTPENPSRILRFQPDGQRDRAFGERGSLLAAKSRGYVVDETDVVEPLLLWTRVDPAWELARADNSSR